MSPNIGLQDMACMRKKDLKETAKGKQEQNEESQGDCKGQCWCWQKGGVKILQ